MPGQLIGPGFSRRLRTDRKLVLALAIIAMFAAPVALGVQQAHAVVTTNPASGSSYATGFADQRKVFGTPTGLGHTTWWIFYTTGSAVKGIEYQYSFDGKTWSTPATLTTNGFTTYGWGFDAYQAGDNIYWVISPASSAKAVYFGEITVNPTTGGVTIDTSGTFNLANAVNGFTTSSITVDGNGYTWVAIYTGTSNYFVETWACKQAALSTCTATPSDWVAQGSASGSSTFALNSNGGTYLTPVLLSLSSGVTNYVALLFVNPNAGTQYGTLDIYYLVSSGSSYVAWTGPSSPASTFYQVYEFSAVVSGTTIYVAGVMATFTNFFTYTLGGIVTPETAVENAGSSFVPTLSISGSTLVLAFGSGATVYYDTAPLSTLVWTLVRSATPPRYIAENTESVVSGYDLSATSGDNGSALAYIWTNSGGVVRFSTLDISAVPVSVQLSLVEYAFKQTPFTETQNVTASNYYTITYWACSPSCSSPTQVTAQYTFSDGQYLTITNIVSQTLVSISATTSGSSTTEAWCLAIGNGAGTQGASAPCSAVSFGASDGVTVRYYYYDLLSEPSVYSVYGGGSPTAPTIHYNTAPSAVSTTGTPSTQNIALAISAGVYQFASKSCASAVSCSITLPSNVVSGDELAVVVMSSVSTSTVNSITDSLLTGYAKSTSEASVAGGDVEMWYAHLASSGADTITVNLKAAAASDIMVYEMQNVKNAAPTSKIGTGTSLLAAVASYAPTVGSIVVSGLSTGCVSACSVSAGSGYTISSSPSGNLALGATLEGVSEFRPVAAATETTPYSLTASSPWNEISTSFAPTSTPDAYWILRNSTSYVNTAVSGQPDEQWAANPADAAWIINAPNEVLANIPYYHQFLNSYTITAAGGLTFDPTVSFVLYGTQYGQPGIAIATLAGSTSSITTLQWTDAGTTVSFPAQGNNVPAGTRWTLSPTSTQVTPIITSGGNVFAVTYFKQYEQSLAYAISDGTTPPVSPPPITYTAFGVVKTPTLNATTSQVWMDAGTTASVTQTYVGGSGERWYTPTASWTITATNIVTNPSIVWYHQFQQTLVYETSDGSAIHGAPSSVTINYYSLGVDKAHLLNLTANVVWLDATKQVFVNDPILGAFPTEQWTVQPGLSSWPSIYESNEVTDPIVYNHQFQVTFVVSPVGTGSITAGGMAVPFATPVWEAAGLPGVSIIGNWIGGYSFGGWSETGSILIEVPGSSSTTAVISGTGTITASFTLVTGLAFVETGMNLIGPSWSVQVTAPSAIPNPGSSGCVLDSGTTYTCSSTSQDIVISSAPVGSYTYTVPSPQAWLPAGTQYAYTGPVPTPVTLSAADPSATVTVPFEVQYLLTVVINPISAGTVAAAPPSSAGASPGWYFGGTIPTLTATATSPGAVFEDWSGWSCAPSCDSPSIQITMNGPETATANFLVPLSISVCTPETAGVGTQVGCSITATGGSGVITLSNSALPSGVTLIYTSNGFPASASGASSTMLITIAPNAPFGVYTWTVTATDSDGLQSSSTYQLTIISPSVTTIGFTTSAYAITYGSQNALFFADNHWFVVYSDGTNLVYRASTDNTGNSWGPATEIVNGIDQGYSFAVANYNNNVYLVLLSPSFTGGFYFASGTVVANAGGASISWTACSGNCGLGPVQMLMVHTAPGLTTAGSPNIYVDSSAQCLTVSPGEGCIWVTIPALDSNLMWHVEVGQLTLTTWKIPAAIGGIGDVQLHAVYTGPDSQVHSELYVMPDAVAATFTVGNTPQYPHITVFDHGYTMSNTYCLGGSLASGFCSDLPASWSGVQIYTQQQQGVVMPVAGTDVVFFAGLATAAGGSADVQFYTFNYNPAGGACPAGYSGTNGGCFSAPTALSISVIPANAVVNHSWHISMAFGGSSLYVAYGIDDQLAFQVGTVGAAPNYAVSWSQAVEVPGVSGLVGGVTISYSGNTVGLTWVQTSGAQYAVKFCVI